MALIKQKTLKTGNTGEYHRIVQMNMNYDRLDCVITIATYKDSNARDAGATPVTQYTLDIGQAFHDEEYTNGEDTMKNVSLKEAYKVFKDKSIAEAAKEDEDEEGNPTDKNKDLAWFADATDV